MLYNPVIYLFLKFLYIYFLSPIPFYLFYNLEFVPLKVPNLFYLLLPPPPIHFLYVVREVDQKESQTLLERLHS